MFVVLFQVIDAFVLPITLILSYFFIKLRYKFNHLLGVIACLCGCGLIITADYLVQIESGKDGGKHRISGDILCFMASVLYAVSNVSSEIFIKDNSKLEYLSMIGFMGTLISLVQMFVLEREEISLLFQVDNLMICKLVHHFCTITLFFVITRFLFYRGPICAGKCGNVFDLHNCPTGP